MKSARNRVLVSLAFLAVVLGCPSLCHAHALHPVYYALGPYPLVFAFSGPVGLLPIFAVLATHGIILRWTISDRTFIENLWQAGITFIASKAGESIPAFTILSTTPWIMWSSDSFTAVVLTPLILLGTGLFVNAAVIGAFHRAEDRGAARVFSAASLLSVTSYALLSLTTLGMLHIGWID